MTDPIVEVEDFIGKMRKEDIIISKKAQNVLVSYNRKVLACFCECVIKCGC